MVTADVNAWALIEAGKCKPPTDRFAPKHLRRTRIKRASLTLALLLMTSAAQSGVLTESDFKRVETIKPLFQNLMVDLVETTKRPDISVGDADCIKAAIGELTQISGELSSYEYLMTIEKEMTDFGENNPMKSIVKFAVDKSNTILISERKRLAELSGRCASYPLSLGKTQQALRVIDTTTTILNSINEHL